MNESRFGSTERMKIYQPRINPPVFSFNQSDTFSENDDSEVKIWGGSKSNNAPEI